MISYSGGMEYDPDDFVAFDTQANGALSQSDDFEPRVRIDFDEDGLVGGIFTQLTGSAEIVWPATEHAFVIEGSVTITYHETGDTIEYMRGDGWIIRKGTRVTWDVTTPEFAKAFFLYGGE